MKGLQLQGLNSELRYRHETLSDVRYDRVVARADVLPKLDYSLCGFSPVHGDKIAVFDVYLDESGTHNDRGLVVAGYVADVNKWADFAVTWKAILTEYHLSYFHMKSFRSRHARAFKHLSHRQKDELLSSLIQCIQETAVMGIALGVRPREYVRLTTPEFRNKYGSSYPLCVEACVGVALHYLPGLKVSSERVGIFLEEGHKNVGQALDFIKDLKKRTDPFDVSDIDEIIIGIVGAPYAETPSVEEVSRQWGYKIGTIGQGSKLDMLPLQAADLLAYCAYSHSMIQGERFCGEIIETLRKQVPHIMSPFGPGLIREIIADVPVGEEAEQAFRRQVYSLARYLRRFGIDAQETSWGVDVKGNLQKAGKHILRWKEEQKDGGIDFDNEGHLIKTT